MDREAMLAKVRELREQGATPKAVAKALGLKRAEADELIRQVAKEAAPVEATLVGCWMNAGWSEGLSWPEGAGWQDEPKGKEVEEDFLEYDDEDDEELPNIVSVVVAREHRYGRVSACVYLVDAQCLGVKDALGPRVIDRSELESFLARAFVAYDRPPLQVSLELAREMVFGAEDYARGLGFQPHRDLEPCRGHLGAWQGPGKIVFGYNGKPLFMAGPHDDAAAVTRILDR